MSCATCESGSDAVPGGDGQRRQPVELEAFGSDRARDHVDVLDAFPILRDGIAREQRLQRLGDILGGQAECAGTVLVDLEPDRLYLLTPIEVRVDDLGVCRNDLPHFFGDRAHFHWIGPDHAELHGEADRRAEQETIDPRASLRQRDGTFEPPLGDGPADTAAKGIRRWADIRADLDDLIRGA